MCWGSEGSSPSRLSVLCSGGCLGEAVWALRPAGWGGIPSRGVGRPDLAPLLPAAAAYYLPRHLAPNPTYPHLYPPYLIRGYPDTAALENRQTIINDYITSQQMHHNAATAMAQRADMLRGLSPRESSLALNYAAGPRGGWGRALPVTWVGRTHHPELALSLVCPGS